MEEVIKRLEIDLDEAQRELDAITEKYSGGGFYSSEDSSMEDYLEGKIHAIEYALHTIKEVSNA